MNRIAEVRKTGEREGKTKYRERKTTDGVIFASSYNRKSFELKKEIENTHTQAKAALEWEIDKIVISRFEMVENKRIRLATELCPHNTFLPRSRCYSPPPCCQRAMFKR